MSNNKITLRDIKLEDLEKYKFWNASTHKYHLLNGPYFRKKTEKEIADSIEGIRVQFESGIENPLPQRKLISNETNPIIGEVSWSWRSKETLWIEIGIVIFDEKDWGKGIGYTAMKSWIRELFDAKKEIIRLGLTTWSGNYGMIKLAEKLKMKKEAEYRKARIVKGNYFDSVSYGILREEWEIIDSRISKDKN